MADLTTVEVITAVRLKLSDDSFDQGMIIDAMNFFVNEIYHNTRTRRMETNDQIFVSAGDTVADFPEDIDVRTALTVTSPQVYDMGQLFLEYGDFMKLFPMWQSSPVQPIQAWTDYGNQVRFSAPVMADSVIDIDYCRIPTPANLVSDGTTPTDSIELDELYKELATLGTLARCMESNEDYAEASSERNNLAPLVTAWIRNEARGGGRLGPIIMRSNRKRGSYYNRNRTY